jgi:flagellar protein FlaH
MLVIQMPDGYKFDLDRDRFGAKLGVQLPESAIGYIEGEDGSGKSIFSQRMIYGLLENGYSVTYMSPEYNVSNFITQMESIGYSCINSLVNKKLLFLAADVDTEDTLVDTNRNRNIITNLIDEKYRSVWDSDVVIIDSFDILIENDPLFRNFSNDETISAIQNLFSYIEEVTETGTTVLFTADPSSIPESVINPVRSRSDIYIRLSVEEKSGSLNKMMEVRRYSMLETRIEEVINFDVSANTGLSIINRTVT